LGDRIARLGDVYSDLLALVKAVESKEDRASDLPARAPRVGEAEDALGKALEVVRAVQTDCAAALDAAKEGKNLPGLTARLATRVGKPLTQCVDECFPRAQKALKAFRANLDGGRADAASAKAAREAMDRLMDTLRRAKDGLDGPPDFGELITALAEVEAGQRDVVRRLRGLAAAFEEELLK
jgi:hypothetical protein